MPKKGPKSYRFFVVYVLGVGSSSGFKNWMGKFRK
jgi:hypothetical protein